jgi:ferrous iron transport protein B
MTESNTTIDKEASAADILERAQALRDEIGGERFRDELVSTLYRRAEKVVAKTVRRKKPRLWLTDETIDRVLTHPVLGIPVMAALFSVVFWITVVGANIPSAFLAGLLMAEGGLTEWFQEYLGIAAPALLTSSLYELLHALFDALRAPSWMSGFLVDGIYLGLAWVVSVMLPPMAIFFPLFTLLEDLGYLPRVAFNLDWLFKKAGAHGKQALTMMMGFGCNAAGVIACRVIDSPREKLIAILTNVFVPCNGRFPTLVTVASLFVAGAVTKPGTFAASLVGTAAVVGVVILGVVTTLIVSWALSRTVLRGEPSAFVLELPPYRRPSVIRVLYTSLIDRTLFVLFRACVIAAPAGGIIWLMANLDIEDMSVAAHVYTFLDPFGRLLGLDGVILLAFIIAIPANEVVMPTAIMLYLSQSRMIEIEGAALGTLLTDHGWTLLTAVSLMLFSLLHNPCGTTIWTIWRETRSLKWTVFGALMPLVIAIVICAIVAGVTRLVLGIDFAAASERAAARGGHRWFAGKVGLLTQPDSRNHR